MRLGGRRSVAAARAFGCALLLPNVCLYAQVVRAVVRESPSGRPVAAAAAFVTDTTGRTLRTVVTNDSGRFTAVTPLGLPFLLSTRHIGHAPWTGRYAPLGAGDTLNVEVTLQRADLTLDTVIIVARQKRPWYDDVSAGHELFIKHFRDGKGVFVGGREIEASGLLLTEFLGKVPGLKISPVRPFGPYLRTLDGQFLTTQAGGQCLVFRVDRRPPVNNPYGGVDGIDPMAIMGVEVYRNFREVPSDWRFDAWTATSSGSTRTRGATNRTACGYIQIWTVTAW